MLTIFSRALWPSVCFLWRVSVLIFFPFCDWVVYLFLTLNYMNCLYSLESNPLSATSFANTSPILQVVLVFFFFFFCAKVFKVNYFPLKIFLFLCSLLLEVYQEILVIYGKECSIHVLF